MLLTTKLKHPVLGATLFDPIMYLLSYFAKIEGSRNMQFSNRDACKYKM